MGLAKEAEAARGDALALRQQLVTEFPAVPYYRQDLAKSYSNLGFHWKNLGQRTAAKQSFQQALEIREKLANEFPTRRDFRLDLAESHHNLGLLSHQLGPCQEAEPAYRRALEIQEKLVDEYPTSRTLPSGVVHHPQLYLEYCMGEMGNSHV